MKPTPSIWTMAGIAAFGVASAEMACGQAFLTWTGNGNNWNNMSRWSGGWTSGEFPYGQLQWTGGGDATSNNNFAPANAWRLFFNGNTSYTITGNEIRLFDYAGAVGGIMSRASGNQIISANVRFSDNGARAGFISTRMGGSGTGGGGGSLTLGNLEIAGAVTELRFSGETGAGAITVNGVISGSGKPVVIGRDHNNDVQNGTVVSLNGNNSYSGGTTLRTGVLRVGHVNALGGGKLTIDSEGSSARTLASSSASAFTLSNNIDLFNNLSLGQTSGGTGSLTLAGTTFLGSDTGVRILDVTGSHSITGAITGNRGLVKQGAGTLAVSGSNTFSGGLFIDSGTLQISGGSLAAPSVDLGASVQVQTGNSATLKISAAGSHDFDLAVKNFGTGAGARSLDFSLTSGTATLTGDMALDKSLGIHVAGGGTAELSGAISGAGGISKTGAGILILSGNTSFTGSLTVNAGTLFASGSLGGSYQVGAGSTLLGTGTIGGDLVMDGASFLEIANFADPLTVSGTVTFGNGFGIANLTGIDWDTLALNQSYTVLQTSTVFSNSNIGNFGIENAVSVGTSGRMAYFQNGSLDIVVIPEPGVMLLVPLSGLLLARRRRVG